MALRVGSASAGRSLREEGVIELLKETEWYQEARGYVESTIEKHGGTRMLKVEFTSDVAHTALRIHPLPRDATRGWPGTRNTLYMEMHKELREDAWVANEFSALEELTKS